MEKEDLVSFLPPSEIFSLEYIPNMLKCYCIFMFYLEKNEDTLNYKTVEVLLKLQCLAGLRSALHALFKSKRA